MKNIGSLIVQIYLKHRVYVSAALLLGAACLYFGVLDDEVVQLQCAATNTVTFHWLSWLLLSYLYSTHLIVVPVGVLLIVSPLIDRKIRDDLWKQFAPVIAWLAPPALVIAYVNLALNVYLAILTVTRMKPTRVQSYLLVVVSLLIVLAAAVTLIYLLTKHFINKSPKNSIRKPIGKRHPLRESGLLAVMLVIAGAASLYIISPAIVEEFKQSPLPSVGYEFTACGAFLAFHKPSQPTQKVNPRQQKLVPKRIASQATLRQNGAASSKTSSVENTSMTDREVHADTRASLFRTNDLVSDNKIGLLLKLVDKVLKVRFMDGSTRYVSYDQSTHVFKEISGGSDQPAGVSDFHPGELLELTLRSNERQASHNGKQLSATRIEIAIGGS